MKKFNLSALLFSVVFFSLLTGCSLLGGGTGTGGGGTGSLDKKYVEVKTDITSDTTWESGKTYYINKDIYVKEGAKLTIKAESLGDIVVKFGPNGRLRIYETSVLDADHVCFTSYRDKEFGEEISGNGGISAAPNDWKGIYVYKGTAKLDNCYIAYAGNGDYPAVLVEASNAKARINKCWFAKNGGKDSATSGTAAVTYKYTAADYNAEDNCVTGTIFNENIWDISIPLDFTLDGSNMFQTSEKASKYQGIFINHYEMSTSAVWASQYVPYCLLGSNAYNVSESLKIDGGSETYPTQVMVGTKTIKIAKTGSLKVGENSIFTNYFKDADTPWGGIVNMGSQRFYSSNTSKNIIIENWEKQIFTNYETEVIQ